ncbi:MAG: hypothetical protein B7Z44_01375 [Caulobacter sp. 12-67-6]|nr:MAG: hypothetical protein B7Z44_01375 [Caulobacter sp. 12-67-6]
MIHHLSVSAADPQGVGEFFADLMNGVVVDFPPNPGSCMVFKADGLGTAIEIYPAGSVMERNGEPGAIFVRQPDGADRRSPTHFALSVEMSPDEVLARAAAKGWDAFVCDRGGHLGFANEVSTMSDPNAALDSHQPQAKTLEPA